MPVGKITILNSAGEAIGVADTSLALHTASSECSFMVDEENSTATLWMLSGSNIFALAAESLIGSPELGGYVTAINHVTPSDDGAFFIHGSPCVSIGYSSNSRLPDKLPLPGDSIHINDLCTTCTSCETVVRLRKIVEHLKIVLNAIKDANLYTQSQAMLRQNYLRSQRVPVTISCKAALDDLSPETLDVFALQSTRLLGQYVTAVHMWNYLASRKGNEVRIGNAPEDAAGFYVQSRFVKPSCDGESDVSATVEIAQVSGQEGLSVYVPPPVVTFSAGSDGGSPLQATVSMPEDAPATVTVARPENSVPGTRAGTYVLQVKWLPFFRVIQTLNGQDVRLDDLGECDLDRVVVPDPDEGGDIVLYGNLDIHTENVPVHGASRDDYIRYRNYLSVVEDGMNRWQITVTWRLTGALNTESVETYYFETPHVRRPVEGLYKSMALHNPGGTGV